MKIVMFNFLLLFLASLLHSQGQNPERIDSLKSVFKTTVKDDARISILMVLADELQNNEPENSKKYSQQAIALAKKNDDFKSAGEAAVIAGLAATNLGVYQEALKYLNDGLKSATLAKDTATIAAAYNAFGLISTSMGNFDKAIEYFNAVLKIGANDKNKREMARGYNNLANLYEKQGNYDDARNNQAEALRISKEMGYSEGIAMSLNSFGLILRRQGEYAESMKNNLEALRIWEVLKDKKGIAYSLQSIGLIYILHGNYPAAIDKLRTSLEMNKRIQNKRAIADSYGNMGWCEGANGNFYESLENLLKALDLFKEIDDRQNSALQHNNIGFLYTKLGNYNEAMANLTLALKIFDDLGDKSNTAETIESIGELYEATGRCSDAIIWLNKAMHLAIRINERKITKECYLAMSKVYARTNDFKNAYLFHKMYTDLKETLDEASSRKTPGLIIKYETENRDREIALLGKEKKILVQSQLLQTAEIKRQTLIRNSVIGGMGVTGIFSLLLIASYNRRRKTTFEKQVSEVEMKALRSQMNPHFIFNSLNSIKNYILENEKDHAAEYLSKFASLMRLILENSREQEIPLERDLSALGLFLELEALRFDNKFKFTFSVDPEIDQENTLIPPLLLQPFVENSILHGLPGKTDGLIQIKIKKIENSIRCIVEDNGIGREQSVIIENGEVKKRASLGMKITRERLNIINQLKKVKTDIRIFDLLDKENKPAGLKVELLLPFETVF